MGGDYTRFTYDPVKGFSGVLKQQGRVSLDSDANEMEEILDRRDRAGMYDTVGQAVYPLTTPDAFKIGVGPGGQLTIGQGRMYVDGILAECFGDMTDPLNTNFDERLNDLVGKDPLLYDDQPFFYTTPAFPALSPTPGVLNRVYLDIWQREVTVFEDYALREVALNGPDTDTRVQTAWQVKVITDPNGGASCLTPLPDALIAPSSARLSSTVAPALPASGPCIINPAGGYTGLENRLYRVEIHTAGTVDGATAAKFKWSRDNASLAARVLSATMITPTDWIITVSSTGRDSWMRFDFGDHIELIDDDIEFSMRETGTSGIMATVISVNHATGEIHVNPEAPLFAIVASRHPRIRRWDFASSVEPSTRDTNNGVAVPLESGISIMFGPTATDTFHAGDFWVFAARTADGSIDVLDSQPPRNTLHHFAQLALVTSGSPPVVTSDCRVPWPPSMGMHEGCCSQVVKVGESIQAAIDALNGIGGCVCLKMGIHQIDEPLHIRQANLTIHGEVPWVTVRLNRGGPHILDIAALSHVSVEGILFQVQDGKAPEAMITVEGVTGGRIANCGLQIVSRTANPTFRAIGIQLTRCREYAIESVDMLDLPNGIVGIESMEISVLDCRLDGPGAKVSGGLVSFGDMGIRFDGRRISGLYVERNVLLDYQRGIQLGDVSPAAIMPGGGPGSPVDVSTTMDGCRIAANLIVRHQGVRPVSGASVIAFAIATHVARCDVVENAMNVETLEHSGILVAGGNTLAQRNEVRSTAKFDPNKPLDSIPIGVAAIETQTDALLCSIRGNLFTGLQQGVRATGIGGGMDHRVDVIDNRIEGSLDLLIAAQNGQLIVGGTNPLTKLLALLENFSAIAIADLSHSRIADNEVKLAVCGVAALTSRGTSVVGNRVGSSIAGVILVSGVEGDVSDNIIDAYVERGTTIGIGLFLLARSVVARNAISRCTEGILSALCTAVRVQDNDLYATQRGIGSLIDTDLELRGNNVEDALLTGIYAMFSLHELTLAHDRTLRCGYRDPNAFSPTPAVGIDTMLSIALVTIEGCHVIDTGESANPAAPVFAGPRYGIRALWAIGARVWGCEVASRPLVDVNGNPAGVNTLSRAVQMRTLPQGVIQFLLKAVGKSMIPFADAADNVIEQSGVTLVELLSNDEIMFATNRCINFFDGGAPPTVLLQGANVTVTGNRIRALSRRPSLAVFFSSALSATGNMTTRGALIVPNPVTAVQMPAPYPNFNANA